MHKTIYFSKQMLDDKSKGEVIYTMKQLMDKLKKTGKITMSVLYTKGN